jgi:hypothetical protein
VIRFCWNPWGGISLVLLFVSPEKRAKVITLLILAGALGTYSYLQIMTMVCRFGFSHSSSLNHHKYARLGFLFSQLDAYANPVREVKFVYSFSLILDQSCVSSPSSVFLFLLLQISTPERTQTSRIFAVHGTVLSQCISFCNLIHDMFFNGSLLAT